MEERVMPNGRIVYGPTDDDPRKISEQNHPRMVIWRLDFTPFVEAR